MNINKGLGYLATAAVAIAILYFTQETIPAIAVVCFGFLFVN